MFLYVYKKDDSVFEKNSHMANRCIIQKTTQYREGNIFLLISNKEN